MTSIYRKEERDCIYQSEKPFPKLDTTYGGQHELLEIRISNWFSSAKRIVVKEGEEKRIEDYLFSREKVSDRPAFAIGLKEFGVEIPSSCYRVEEKCEVAICSFMFKCQYEKTCEKQSVAVFVDSVPHAKGLRFVDPELQKRFDEIPKDFKNEVRNKLMEPHAKEKCTCNPPRPNSTDLFCKCGKKIEPSIELEPHANGKVMFRTPEEFTNNVSPSEFGIRKQLLVLGLLKHVHEWMLRYAKESN